MTKYTFALFLVLILLIPSSSKALELDCPEGQIACSYNGGATEECYVGTSCPAEPSNTENDGAATGDGSFVNPLKVDSVDEFVQIILTVVSRALQVVLVVAIVWVGFLFIWAQGNKDRLSEAKTALTYTIIGGLIVIGINVIASIIISTLAAL